MRDPLERRALCPYVQTPFVMGTTGGDRVKLLADVAAAKHFAVIAPQMGKQVVAFQAAMRLMAENFPGAFKGYKLTVTESHQSSKAGRVTLRECDEPLPTHASSACAEEKTVSEGVMTLWGSEAVR